MSEKPDSQITMRRGKHDKENPYVMISKKMLRDQSISPKAKGLLCFMLSLPDDWIMRPKQVAKAMAISPDQVYTILKELIPSGYAVRTRVKNSKGQYGPTSYDFFEEKQQISTVSQNPETANPDMGMPDMDFPDVDLPDQETPTIQNTYIQKTEFTEDISSNILTPPIPPHSEESNEAKASKKKFSKDFSDDLKQLAEAIKLAVLKEKPNFAVKNYDAWLISLDQMIRLDKRDPHKIISVMRWALSDEFWRSNMFKPNPVKYLRDKYDQFEEKMIIKPKQKDRRFAASSDNERAKKIMDDFSKGAI